MYPGVDHIKASTLFHYCGKAAHTLVHRDFVRKQLEEQIRKVSRIADKDLKGQLAELERRIGDAIAMEQRLKGHQGEEDLFHRKLRDKIELLERRLGVFIENRESRTQRIRELEKKILERLATKTQKITAVKDDIRKLEKMHRDIAQSGRYKKKLQQVDQRLDQLKARLKALEES